MWHNAFSTSAPRVFPKRGFLRPSLACFSFHILFAGTKRIWPSETKKEQTPQHGRAWRSAKAFPAEEMRCFILFPRLLFGDANGENKIDLRFRLAQCGVNAALADKVKASVEGVHKNSHILHNKKGLFSQRLRLFSLGLGLGRHGKDHFQRRDLIFLGHINSL